MPALDRPGGVAHTPRDEDDGTAGVSGLELDSAWEAVERGEIQRRRYESYVKIRAGQTT